MDGVIIVFCLMSQMCLKHLSEIFLKNRVVTFDPNSFGRTKRMLCVLSNDTCVCVSDLADLLRLLALLLWLSGPDYQTQRHPDIPVVCLI